MKTLIIGIDPGKAGGIAAIDETGSVVKLEKMPATLPDMYELLDELGRIPCDGRICYMEKVGQGMPGQSSKATATFARHCGHLEALLLALGIPTVEVTPNKWMKSLGIGTAAGMGKGEWKNRLKAHAQTLYPGLWKAKAITLATCDALLIARYGREKEVTR